MKIKEAYCGKEIEPLLHAFQFKGSALTQLWQSAVHLKGEKDEAVGLGVQSVLWADDKLFAAMGEDAGNDLMFQITRYAVSLLEGEEFDTPPELFQWLFSKCHAYCKTIAGDREVNETFVLNALVPVDFAVWMLYARENKIKSFDEIMSMGNFSQAHEEKLANIPLITYGTSISEIEELAKDGCCVFKIKIGSDPDKDGNMEKMLEWDKKRLYEIHACLKDRKTPYTKDGHLYYYLDANCRYDSKERMQDFLEYAREIGAFSRILVLEEPFFEGNEIFVGDMGVCVAADESIHDMVALDRAIALGYGAMTLKPIAKTLSYTLLMLQKCAEAEVTCFCADLTVNPVMVEWNKNVAARLQKFPQLYVGLVESNGAQNYRNWEKMQTYNPSNGLSFQQLKHGVYSLTQEFYQCNGKIFEIPEHYLEVSNQC